MLLLYRRKNFLVPIGWQETADLDPQKVQSLP
jgi:hypothetical protein